MSKYLYLNHLYCTVSACHARPARKVEDSDGEWRGNATCQAHDGRFQVACLAGIPVLLAR